MLPPREAACHQLSSLNISRVAQLLRRQAYWGSAQSQATWLEFHSWQIEVNFIQREISISISASGVSMGNWRLWGKHVHQQWEHQWFHFSRGTKTKFRFLLPYPLLAIETGRLRGYQRLSGHMRQKAGKVEISRLNIRQGRNSLSMLRSGSTLITGFLGQTRKTEDSRSNTGYICLMRARRLHRKLVRRKL